MGGWRSGRTGWRSTCAGGGGGRGRGWGWAGLLGWAGGAESVRGVGVGAETVVGLCLPPGVGMVVVMLAVWKAGGAWLPLDPGYPPERLAFMLADSQVTVLVSERAA